MEDTMRYYKNKNNEFFGVDTGQENLIQEDWIESSLEEIEKTNEQKRFEMRQTQAYKNLEARQALAQGDWKVIRELERLFLKDSELNKQREALRDSVFEV